MGFLRRRPTSTVIKTSTDSLNISTQETYRLAGVKKTAGDILSTSLGEVTSLQGRKKSAVDLLGISLGEVATRVVRFLRLTRSDTLSVSLGESTNPGAFTLSAASFSGQEGTALSIPMLRVAGGSDTVAVDWTLTGFSEGTPSPASGTLTWPSGDTTSKLVNITLGTVTANRSGTITFSNARNLSGGTAPGLLTPTATITITNVVVVNAPPQWTTVPNFQSAAGAFSQNVGQYASDPEGQPLSFNIASTSPSSSAQLAAAGLALNPQTGVISGTYDGTTSLNLIVEADDGPAGLNPDAEYAAQAAASGVFYATNFSAANRTALLNLAHSVVNPTWNGNNKIDIETGVKLSGTSALRINLFAAEGANEAAGAFRYSFDGPGQTTVNTLKNKFYSLITLYCDSVFATFDYTNGAKLWIQFHPTLPSFDWGEVVLNRRIGTLLDSYRFVPGIGSVRMSLHWPAFSEWTWHSFVNRGAPTVVDATTLKQRHGLTQYSTANDSDVNVAHDKARVVANGWVSIQTYIDLENDIVKIWVAPYGEAPELYMGAMDAHLPTVAQAAGDCYRGGLLLPRTENAFDPPALWPSVNTFVVYDRLICSDNPIVMHGHSIPYPGTDMPPNYPPAGASEYNG